ncbi:MAG: GTP-binding protein [Lachnospiraceae bacterium]|nr:GTP-binding protein [Lachnospiraceae bacterium]
MTKVDIISGFLGAGKTTLIKKLLAEALQGEQVVLIENEFGEIGIDGGFLQDAGVEIREMNSGCICCSLVGDFGKSLEEVLHTYHPDRIIIEPSGVGKLSDVIVAVRNATAGEDVLLNSSVTVVDVSKCKMYMKNFGEFFNNQIESAGTVVLSRTGTCKAEKLDQALEMIRGLNAHATIVTTPWEQLTGAQLLETMEQRGNLAEEMLREMEEAHRQHEAEHEHEHHHHDHEEHHHHHDHEDEHHHHDHEEHHHHDHEEEHHHHHDHEEEHHHHDHEEHHHHDHEGHHHHHADDVFTSWGFETPKAFTAAQLEDILTALGDEALYGQILRAKGMVPDASGETWLYFDMVPGEKEIREGGPQVTGKICVIGAKIHTEKLEALFGAKEA